MEAIATARRFRNREEVRRYIAVRTAVSIDDMPSVRFWRAAGRATLLTLLVYSALQFYFLHVMVEIIELPALTTFGLR